MKPTKAKRFILIAVVLGFVLSGCEKAKTVEWYIEHHAERKTMLEKCNNSPGEMRMKPDCVNAGAAVDAVFFGDKPGSKEKK